MRETRGICVEWGETGPINPGEYAKHPTQGWFGTTPNDHGVNLTQHQVTEHEDGTITVVPSILVVTSGGREVWHGFLERGVWKEC